MLRISLPLQIDADAKIELPQTWSADVQNTARAMIRAHLAYTSRFASRNFNGLFRTGLELERGVLVACELGMYLVGVWAESDNGMSRVLHRVLALSQAPQADGPFETHGSVETLQSHFPEARLAEDLEHLCAFIPPARHTVDFEEKGADGAARLTLLRVRNSPKFYSRS